MQERSQPANSGLNLKTSHAAEAAAWATRRARPAASVPSRWNQPRAFAPRIPREFSRRPSSWEPYDLFQFVDKRSEPWVGKSRTSFLRRWPPLFSARERFPLASCRWLFRTQLASTISAPEQTPAPTFWAADASSTTPVPPQAYAGSLQPSGNNSWPKPFLRLHKKGR